MIKSSERCRDVRSAWALYWPDPRSLYLLAAVLTGPALAADPPKPAPPAAQTQAASTTLPTIVGEPGDALNAMADSLAKNGALIAASAGGLQITQADVADAMRAMPVSMANLGFPALYRHVLDELMNEKLASLAARAAGLDKDPDVIRRQRDAADHVLAQAWVSQKENAAVTEEALRALYDREIAGKPGPAEVRARVILVPTEAQADSLIAKLQAGEQFDDLAHQYSKDWTAVAGGDMGWLPLASLSPQVGAAMFALAPGQYTQFPVRSQPGYFIIRVEGRRQRATPTFEEARGMLVHQLRREAGGKAVQSLISDSKINVPDGQGGTTAVTPAGR